MADRAISFGEVSPESEVFWNAAKEGKFLVKKCKACNKVHWYPRAICPFCMSPDTEWVPGAGTGKIYSFSHMARANLTIAYVTLAEGPTMMTNIVDCDLDAIRIGQKVKVTFKKTAGGHTMPVFAPA